MAVEVCCVCGKPVTGAAKMLGGRAFCEEHYARVGHNRKGMWTAILALIVGLAAFVAAVFFLAPDNALSGPALVAVGLLLALVPAVIWLVVFYLQDRAEPEPKKYLSGVFILGLLLAAAVGQPLIQNVFQVNEWASGSLGLRLLAGITIVGTIQEFLKYAAVRYSIFNSPEFDERIDGIIYGAAAGLGYATYLNVDYVLSNGGVDLGVGAVRVAVVALAQASFAGVTGYFLGRAKFENRGPFWLPAGLLLAAVLNGVVTTLLSEITRTGLRPTPLNGLILAAVVAAATFAILFAIMRRSSRPAPAAAGGAIQ
jgi:RsiW-degrading membrane proteinase PrsW (M82 family)